MRIIKTIGIVAVCLVLFTGCASTADSPLGSLAELFTEAEDETAQPAAADETPETAEETKEETAPETAEPEAAPALPHAPPDGQGVLHFTLMVHLEGWNDTGDEAAFEKHAQKLRDMAGLFEQYGAKLTIESKEFTAGCIKWEDNVLLEMQERGHSVGVHADLGGQRRTSQRELTQGIAQMKRELESLGVTVRHVSGICSDKDWVRAALEAGYEATTGMVSYGLWALSEQNRPAGFVPYDTPMEGHAPYPWDAESTVLPWYAKSGADWITPSGDGLLIVPSGIGLTAAYEDETGNSNGAGTFDFDNKDIAVWRRTLNELLTFTDSGEINTYYGAYSLGSPADLAVLEDWLQMIDEYVQDGRVVWTTVPEMIDLIDV